MSESFDWAAHATKAFSDTEGDEMYEKRLFKETSQKKFIGDVVENDIALNKHAKKQFKKKFLKLYLEDEDFREEVKDQYVLFINQEYVGVYPTIKKINATGKNGDDRYCIKISGHLEYALAKHSIPIEIVQDRHWQDCVETFKTNFNQNIRISTKL